MAGVVEEVNRNNQAIPTLRARVGYKATVVDAKKRGPPSAATGCSTARPRGILGNSRSGTF
jgi:hypothetical protein